MYVTHFQEAVRRMHPFPILERFVDKDVVVKGKLCVKANSQVYSLSPAAIGACYGHILSPLLRLAPATGIFSLPFCDWRLLRAYSLAAPLSERAPLFGEFATASVEAVP
eukprot:7790785-Pyramimonas_sp.AAC.1